MKKYRLHFNSSFPRSFVKCAIFPIAYKVEIKTKVKETITPYINNIYLPCKTLMSVILYYSVKTNVLSPFLYVGTCVCLTLAQYYSL